MIFPVPAFQINTRKSGAEYRIPCSFRIGYEKLAAYISFIINGLFIISNISVLKYYLLSDQYAFLLVSIPKVMTSPSRLHIRFDKKMRQCASFF